MAVGTISIGPVLLAQLGLLLVVEEVAPVAVGAVSIGPVPLAGLGLVLVVDEGALVAVGAVSIGPVLLTGRDLVVRVLIVRVVPLFLQEDSEGGQENNDAALTLSSCSPWAN